MSKRRITLINDEEYVSEAKKIYKEVNLSTDGNTQVTMSSVDPSSDGEYCLIFNIYCKVIINKLK